MNYPINKGSKFFFFPFISVVYNMYDDACVFNIREREREREREVMMIMRRRTMTTTTTITIEKETRRVNHVREKRQNEK